MKAVKITGMNGDGNGKGKSVVVTEQERPTIRQPNEVLAKVLCVGLDGTDRELINGPYGTPPAGETELIFGHEALGVVVETGSEVGLKKGDLVSIVVRRACHEPACVNCRNGRSDYCQSGAYTERGIKGAHGYLTEYIVDEERFFIKIPTECRDYGMLAEPQSIVEKVWDEVQHIQQRLIWQPKEALVLGSGPLGLLAALTSRCLDLNVHVWSMSAPDSPEAQLIERIGGVYHQAGKGDGSQTLSDYVKQLGLTVDLIWECTGYSPLVFEAIDVLGPNGVLAMLGLSAGGRKTELATDHLNMEMVLENKCVVGSVNAARKHFETGIYRLQQMNEKFPGIFSQLLTKRLAIEDVPTFRFEEAGIKAVVDLVPPSMWEREANNHQAVEYSFSV
ncbi:threonine dehydrogenase-like Zn-dependent dehydrogenase [Paenibacillus phyllosphaerae]|uniref:Threonine dehydrogenase-like Zn-dependent dehydrogenase n=1 Tax=Paenibacillus phyllosphaerae TaxID=274593 RepID=A0A7W5B346_9BACL|nr:glucose 1-dehydrogenase [Paenibacillus phyllosphaerae]MBB3113539.1 threonine dehydrogenase-like Zn-dependent dehydrogenase [Paenibacillus phyllosphaerae]